jgi:four helix bundle protein
MASVSFEKLRVYQMAEDLADAVWHTVRRWPILAKDTVGKQLIRAADAIGANIAEGSGRGTYADNRRFVRMARGSLYEVRHWLRRAFRRQMLSTDQTQHLKTLIESLGPSLNAYLRSIGRSKIGNSPGAKPRRSNTPRPVTSD